jgi:hypothetical protein
MDLYHDEQHVEAAQEDRVDVEEITGEQAAGLDSQECSPGCLRSAWCFTSCAPRRIRRTVESLTR